MSFVLVPHELPGEGLERVAALLHAAAALLALVVIGSMYVFGLAFDYRAGWDSTWLDAEQVQRTLAAVQQANPQLNAHGELIHLLSIEGLPRAVLTQILDTAGTFLSVNDREVKKVPLLRGKSVFNLFFENSTRTRTTFEIAAKRLSADVINLDINKSSTAKGESLLDTIANLSAMHADMFVVRHAQSGAAHLIARHQPDVGGPLRRPDRSFKVGGFHGQEKMKLRDVLSILRDA